MYTYRLVESEKDYAAVVALVMRTYAASGYVPKEREHEHLSIHEYTKRHGSATIAAFNSDELIGTVAIVRDSDRGVPADAAYRTEIGKLRALPGQLAEVCQLAVAPPSTTGDQNQLPILFGLLSHTIHFCVHEHIQHVCFVVNPKHQAFYESLGANIIGPVRVYEAANNAPAVPFHLDLSVDHREETAPVPRLLRELLQQQPAETFFSQSALDTFRGQ